MLGSMESSQWSKYLLYACQEYLLLLREIPLTLIDEIAYICKIIVLGNKIISEKFFLSKMSGLYIQHFNNPFTIDGHEGWFHTAAIVNDGALDNAMQFSVWTSV
jgi:hypothetical protein